MVFFINKYEFDASVNIFFLLKEDYAAIYLSLKKLHTKFKSKSKRYVLKFTYIYDELLALCF